MEEIRHIGKRLVRNRVGILAEVKTCHVAATYYSDGEWKTTTTVIKFIKNR